MEEKVYFKTSDSLKLCGILTKPQNFKNSRKNQCIILCHGIGYDKYEDGLFTQLASKIASAGFTVFRFDFRSHGESEGNSIEMTVKGEKEDLESAINFLVQRGYLEFGILAVSFGGGAVSLALSSNSNLAKALVLWNPVIDYREMLEPILPWMRENWGKKAFEDVRNQGFSEIGGRKYKIGRKLLEEISVLKIWEELLKVKIPVLFIHGDKDAHVPYEDSLKYSKMMPNAKLETIVGGEHNFSNSKQLIDSVCKKTVDFFLKNM